MNFNTGRVSPVLQNLHIYWFHYFSGQYFYPQAFSPDMPYDRFLIQWMYFTCPFREDLIRKYGKGRPLQKTLKVIGRALWLQHNSIGVRVAICCTSPPYSKLQCTMVFNGALLQGIQKWTKVCSAADVSLFHLNKKTSSSSDKTLITFTLWLPMFTSLEWLPVLPQPNCGLAPTSFPPKDADWSGLKESDWSFSRWIGRKFKLEISTMQLPYNVDLCYCVARIGTVCYIVHWEKCWSDGLTDYSWTCLLTSKPILKMPKILASHCQALA